MFAIHLLQAVVFYSAVAVSTKDKFCKPTPCLLETSANPTNMSPRCQGRTIRLEPFKLNVDAWNDTLNAYIPLGQVDAYKYHEKDFGLQMHGAKVFPGSKPSPNSLKRDIYVANSGEEAIYSIQNIPSFSHSRGFLNETNEAMLTLVTNVLAPSTMEFLQDDKGEYLGMLVAEGNPFAAFQKLNNTAEYGFGQLEAVMKDQTCKTVFPNKETQQPWNEIGICINTVECVPGMDLCFLSGWRFWDSSNKIKMLFPDCMHWCKLDNLSNPTTCTHQGVVKYANGTRVCAADGNGGVHGLMIMNKEAIKPKRNMDGSMEATLELLTLYTGGPMWDRGDSQMIKFTIDARVNGLRTELTTKANEPFAVDLWRNTVSKPHDVGLDHSWQDSSGKIWASSFRRMNNGIHLLTPEGKLLLSVHGFDLSIPLQYSYPSGVSGFGSAGEKDSFVVVTSSNINTPIIGQSAFFIVDVSQLGELYPLLKTL